MKEWRQRLRLPPTIVPRFLRPGDPVSVLAPSGVVDRRRLMAGLGYLKGRGHPATLAPHVFDRRGYLAGHDDVRAGDFNDLIEVDPSPAIFLARGGFGMTRILGRVGLDALRQRPRVLLGYSDATALFMALQKEGPYLVHYGPSVSELGEPAAFDEKSLWSALYGEASAFEIPFRPSDVLRPGRGVGRLLGGCLTLLVSLLGTPFDPDYRDAVLFWEEVSEEPYRIDRMLTQLRNAGKLDHLRGMVVGSLSGCLPAPDRPTLKLREIILDHAQVAHYPVVWNLPAGHVAGKLTLPLGPEVSLNTTSLRLRYLRPRRGSREIEQEE